VNWWRTRCRWRHCVRDSKRRTTRSRNNCKPSSLHSKRRRTATVDFTKSPNTWKSKRERSVYCNAKCVALLPDFFALALLIEAHNALAYCGALLFSCGYLFFYLDLRSQKPVGRLPRYFARWSEAAMGLIHWHQISHELSPIKIVRAKNCAKFVVSLDPISYWASVVLSLDKFSAKTTFCQSTLFSLTNDNMTPNWTAFIAFCSVMSRSRHFYTAYDVLRSAKRCHLRMKMKEPHCGLFSGKVTNVAISFSLLSNVLQKVIFSGSANVQWLSSPSKRWDFTCTWCALCPAVKSMVQSILESKKQLKTKQFTRSHV